MHWKAKPRQCLVVVLLLIISATSCQARKSASRPSVAATRPSTPRKLAKKARKSVSGDTKKLAASSDHTVSQLPVAVEAILLPRILPVKGLIGLGCISLISLFLFQCVATAGLPYIQNVWGILHGYDIPMPDAYFPSMAEIHLSRLVATSMKEVLPPISLPSVGPLLGFFASILVFILTTILIPRWSTTAKVVLEYRKISPRAPNLSTTLLRNPTRAAVLVRILDRHLQNEVAADRQGDGKKSQIICQLHCVANDGKMMKSVADINATQTMLGDHFSHPASHFFEVNQCRFYYDASKRISIDGGPLLHDAPIQILLELLESGISPSRKQRGHERYEPYNRPTLATPSIAEAFVARISSPLVVIQLIGSILSCLEDGLQALFGLIMAAGEHYFNARQAIVSARQMADEVKVNVQDTSSLQVHILERKEDGTQAWVSKTAGDLIPGDIFALKQDGSEIITTPVDALLLSGQVLANEAVLTGESVPQSKLPIDFQERLEENMNAKLNIDADRNSVLFAGTTLIQSSNTANVTKVQGVSLPPFGKASIGAICVALRTGTYSSKGKLLRTLKSGSHVGAISNRQSEKDAIRLLLSMSLFAFASCISLFVPQKSTTGALKTSAFRRIIQCTRILIAGIPSDLPLALSAVARSCSSRLRQDSDVVCSEPGSLLTAAYIDTVVFDKTGTITADTQSVSDLIPSLFNSTDPVLESFQLAQLAGCHSLIHLATSASNGKIVGDPLDQAAFARSGWKYIQSTYCYELADNQKPTSSKPVRLWQLQTFPFDPSKRLSTAVVAMEYGNGSIRLFSFTKGSPDTVRGMLKDRAQDDFISRYDSQVKGFEVQGYRSIAMGWRDLSETELGAHLFPNGITKDDIEMAKKSGTLLHRKDVEVDFLEFGGFAQFDASIRPSSQRIIEELDAGGIKSIMLTGDAVDAAVTVARKVGIVKRRRIAILEESQTRAEPLQWRVLNLRRTKKDKSTNWRPKSETIPFSPSTLTDIVRQETLGKTAIGITGRALDLLFDRNDVILLDSLPQVSVIARATPEQKKRVISHLKEKCRKRVMMCGDGVNDVAAMKAADVAVSFLNGFGNENMDNEGLDFDDQRRRKNIEAQLLGSQRLKKRSERMTKSKEDRNRVNREIENAQTEIRARVAARTGVEPDSKNLEFQFQDLKDMISVSLRITKAEQQRQKSLRRGGGDAARILAQERQTNNDNTSDNDDQPPAIKPGEASLVAPFSCLHPSIDGVDAVLRASIGTAACALATQELVCLHSLMSCANMASLYREGVRYGKKMMTLEHMLYLLVDQQRFQVSRIPRPRLPASSLTRPPASMFEFSAILRTLTQALLNLIIMNVVVRYAKGLEMASGVNDRFHLELDGSYYPPKLSQILKAIASAASATSNHEQEDDGPRVASLFRRPRFKANFETNAIFIFSVLQNMLISLTNHRGNPFCRGVLENETLSSLALAVVGICVACVSESFPKLNAMLQLKAWPHRASQRVFLGFLILNIFTSLGVNWIFLSAETAVPCAASKSKSKKDAAGLEEKLLAEEFDRNLRRCFIGIGIIGYLASSVIL